MGRLIDMAIGDLDEIGDAWWEIRDSLLPTGEGGVDIDMALEGLMRMKSAWRNLQSTLADMRREGGR